MSSLAKLLGLQSYRSSLDTLLALDDAAFQHVTSQVMAEYPAVLQKHLDASGEDKPEDLIERAFLVAYEASVRDGHDAVAADIRTSLSESDPIRVERLLAALHPSEEARLRAAGLSARDSVLPILETALVSLDLRVVTTDTETVLVPLASVRLTFDEPVSGNGSAVVFQMSPDAAKKLRSSLDSYLTELQSTASTISSARIPDWGVSGV